MYLYKIIMHYARHITNYFLPLQPKKNKLTNEKTANNNSADYYRSYSNGNPSQKGSMENDYFERWY